MLLLVMLIGWFLGVHVVCRAFVSGSCIRHVMWQHVQLSEGRAHALSALSLARIAVSIFFFKKLRAQMRCLHGSCVLKPRAYALAARPLRCSPATEGTRKVLPV